MLQFSVYIPNYILDELLVEILELDVFFDPKATILTAQGSFGLATLNLELVNHLREVIRFFFLINRKSSSTTSSTSKDLRIAIFIETS